MMIVIFPLPLVCIFWDFDLLHALSIRMVQDVDFIDFHSVLIFWFFSTSRMCQRLNIALDDKKNHRFELLWSCRTQITVSLSGNKKMWRYSQRTCLLSMFYWEDLLLILQLQMDTAITVVCCKAFFLICSIEWLLSPVMWWQPELCSISNQSNLHDYYFQWIWKEGSSGSQFCYTGG